MADTKVKELELLAEKAKGAIRLMVDQIHTKGYRCNLFYLGEAKKQDYDTPFMDGKKWSSYVDDILNEMRLEICRYSSAYGKAYIIGIIRKFSVIDSYCHPQSSIKDKKISTKGIVEAFEQLQLKYKDLRDVGYATYAIDFAYFYNICFKRKFIILCQDCGFDYYEIEESIFPSEPKETQATARQELPTFQPPKELRTPKAIEIFSKAVEAGLMEQQGERYKWLCSDRECVYFAKCFNVIIWGKPNENPKGRSRYKNERFKWKPFEQEFGKKNFAQEWRKIDFVGFDYPNVDKVFS